MRENNIHLRTVKKNIRKLTNLLSFIIFLFSYVLLTPIATATPSQFCHVTDGIFTACSNSGEEWSDVTGHTFTDTGGILWSDQADLADNSTINPDAEKAGTVIYEPDGKMDHLMLMYENDRMTPLGDDEYVLLHFMTVDSETQTFLHYNVRIYANSTIQVFVNGVERGPGGRQTKINTMRGAVGFGPSALNPQPHVLAEFQIGLEAAGFSICCYSPDPAWWSSITPPPPPPPAGTDIAVSKTAMPKITDGKLYPGDEIAFKITAVNVGISDASSVLIRDTLSSNVQYLSDSCGGSIQGNTWSVTIPSLSVGGTFTCTIQTKVKLDLLGYEIKNTVNASASGDTNSANNTDSTTNNINFTCPPIVDKPKTIDYLDDVPGNDAWVLYTFKFYANTIKQVCVDQNPNTTHDEFIAFVYNDNICAVCIWKGGINTYGFNFDPITGDVTRIVWDNSDDGKVAPLDDDQDGKLDIVRFVFDVSTATVTILLLEDGNVVYEHPAMPAPRNPRDLLRTAFDLVKTKSTFVAWISPDDPICTFSGEDANNVEIVREASEYLGFEFVPAPPIPKVLIYGPASGSLSFASKAQTLGYDVTVFDQTQWVNASADTFSQYRVIVVPTLLSQANATLLKDSNSVWGAALNGNLVVTGLHADQHFNQGATDFVNNALEFAVSGSGTGFIALTDCASPQAYTWLPQNGPFVGVSGQSCVATQSLHIVDTSDPIVTTPILLTDASLSNWNQSLHTYFTSIGGFKVVATGSGGGAPADAPALLVYTAKQNTDSDNDGIVDNKDNCPTISNSDQTDNNFNGLGDACESIAAFDTTAFLQANRDGENITEATIPSEGAPPLQEQLARVVQFRVDTENLTLDEATSLTQNLVNSQVAIGVIDGSAASQFVEEVLVQVDLAREVVIDIKPGSFPNSIKLNDNGAIPVAILSDNSFDATTIDASSVMLNSASIRVRGNGVAASYEDVNGDGIMDIIVQIERGEFVNPGDSIGVVTAKTIDGISVTGTDSIRVIE